eukprot:TRINITY_DN5778_c1_g1_i2.p1 TRINITY_DN5778_c1_g1~~TRINITY_DN5778_c1_g1_i2.p1  ORF type:complete len:249 (+),score=34.82 TRINITY_DN5778_c1_g1_i2:288-1034(+)
MVGDGIQEVDISSNYMCGPFPPWCEDPQRNCGSTIGYCTEIYPLYTIFSKLQVPPGDPLGPCMAASSSSWHGVTCSPDLHIIRLDLSSRNATGMLSPSLASLTYLEYLDLSHNSITGPVPSLLKSLPSLLHLDLAHNKLSDSILWLTSNISLTQISVYLDLSYNNLYGHMPLSSPPPPSLSYVDLSCNRFCAPLPAWCKDDACAPCPGQTSPSCLKPPTTTSANISGLPPIESDDDSFVIGTILYFHS